MIWSPPTRHAAPTPRPRGRRSRCSTPTTRCGSGTSSVRWTTRAACSPARSTTGGTSWRDWAGSSACPPTGPAPRWRRSSATPSSSTSAPRSAGGSRTSPARPARPCSWSSRRVWPPCCPVGAPERTSRWAAGSPAARTRHWRIWSGSSSTPWYCERTCQVTLPSANWCAGYGSGAWVPSRTRTSRSTTWWRY